MRKAIGPIIGVLIALLVAGVAFLNQSTVTLNLWFTQVSLPLWALLAGTFLLGLLAGILFLMPGLQSRGHRVHELEDELDQTKREKETIAEETRRESEADLTQKNSEINGLLARIESLENEVRDRIRNSGNHAPHPAAPETLPEEETPVVSDNQPLPSRKERRANKPKDENNRRNGTDESYPESPENNQRRPDVDSNVESRPTDHKSFDRRDDEEYDSTERRTDDRDPDRSPDADLVIKEVDDTDTNR